MNIQREKKAKMTFPYRRRNLNAVFFAAVFTCWGANEERLRGQSHSTDDAASQAVASELPDPMMATTIAFRKSAESIQPSLVAIESFGGVGTVQGKIGGIERQGEGATTGVMISTDGFILTSSFNFIQRQPIISVITHDGVRRIAGIVGKDEIRKICLLKVDGIENAKVPEIAKINEMQVGQWTLSVGFGYGDATPAISKGILSAKNRIGGKAIQTDARISPANYGGPLLDIEGRLMGICVPLNPQSSAMGAGVEWYDSGIGFAIPLDGLEATIERLKKGETISPPFLGVAAKPNQEVLGPKAPKGLWIERVIKDSPAMQAGLLQEDVIIAIEGKEVANLADFKQMLDRFEAGMTIQLNVIKEGKESPETLEIELGSPPVAKDIGNQNPIKPQKTR